MFNTCIKKPCAKDKDDVQLALVCNVTIICLHTLLPDVFTDFFPTCDIRDVAEKSWTPLANY
jgi:hypothetical protein